MQTTTEPLLMLPASGCFWVNLFNPTEASATAFDVARVWMFLGKPVQSY
jgi:hypothetical protein